MGKKKATLRNRTAQLFERTRWFGKLADLQIFSKPRFPIVEKELLKLSIVINNMQVVTALKNTNKGAPKRLAGA